MVRFRSNRGYNRFPGIAVGRSFRVYAGQNVFAEQNMKRALLAALGLGGATFTLAVVTSLPGSAEEGREKAAKVDFDRDVRPILSENCFKCHGPDEKARAASLRLDTQEGAWRKSIVPGKPTSSPMFQRIATKVDAAKMPPITSGKSLKPQQIETLRKWIAQGAKYEKHWSFIPPVRPTVPRRSLGAGQLKDRRLASIGTLRPAADKRLNDPWLWCRNPIDNFILDRLLTHGVLPSPEADRRTLIRRVTFDLTGLPPKPEEVEAFLADRRPDAYERVVDRLLASPQYGERMAVQWLDLARYADTHGYHIDSGRQMWRWRDWLIDAYNRNMPYDEFVVEQLAGDLQPNSTLSQKIATGFNRNHPINFEGGAIPEEYQAAYIFDRIDTTATTFMGLTLRCGQCHDHKYDPFSQKDYYRLYAFFNNVPELGLDGQSGNAKPFIKSPTPEQEAELASLSKKVGELDAALKARAKEAVAAFGGWEKTALASTSALPALTQDLAAHFGLDETSGDKVKDSSGKAADGTVKGPAAWAPGKFGGSLKLDGATYIDGGSACNFDWKEKFSYGAWVNPASNEHMVVMSRMDNADKIRGWDLYLGDGKVFVHFIHAWEDNAIRVNTKTQIPVNQWSHLFVTYDGSGKAAGLKVYVNGKPTELDVTHDKLSATIKTEKPLHIGNRDGAAPFKGQIDEVRSYSRELSAADVAQLANIESIRHILTVSPEKRSEAQKGELTRFYLENYDEAYAKLAAQHKEWEKKRSDYDQSIPTTMVMEELAQPRETHLLLRGEYDKKGEKLAPGVPAVLADMPKDAPGNRLGLAKWLAGPDHPLTSRVAVNRYWQLIFGVGLVKTVEDFGTQGERPSHPELLDWLAVEFMKGDASSGSRSDLTTQRANDPSAWNIKRLIRLMVTSATYRQSSAETPKSRAKDPENRLLGRAPRFRLPAEFVRDQALTLSGLLVPKIGGPSVKPYHPKGLWEDLAFGGGFTEQTYVQGKGDDLYRRSMYTFWKRTCPPPSLQTFDAPEREFCMVRRSVTNTPLQALVLMNDPTYVEAARKFAERMMTEAPASTQARIDFAFKWALSRPPRTNETRLLTELFNRQLATYRSDTKAAEKILSVGESPRNPKLEVSELAAWATVASTIMNLDETITKN